MSIIDQINRISTNIGNTFTSLGNLGATLPSTQDSANLNATTNSVIPRLPANCAGLVFWLDGDCNTRAGVDRSKTYFENLVWNAPVTQVEGNCENKGTYSNNSWNSTHSNLLNIGTQAAYPFLDKSDEITIETVYMFTNIPTAYTGLLSTNYTHGYNWAVYNGGANIGYIIGSSTWDTSCTMAIPSESGKIRYIFARVDKNNNRAQVGREGVVKTTVNYTSAIATTENCNTGFCGSRGTGTGVGEAHYSNIAIGMMRVWNRLLTNDELLKNYADAKNRFGCE